MSERSTEEYLKLVQGEMSPLNTTTPWYRPGAGNIPVPDNDDRCSPYHTPGVFQNRLISSGDTQTVVQTYDYGLKEASHIDNTFTGLTPLLDLNKDEPGLTSAGGDFTLSYPNVQSWYAAKESDFQSGRIGLNDRNSGWPITPQSQQSRTTNPIAFPQMPTPPETTAESMKAWTYASLNGRQKMDTCFSTLPTAQTSNHKKRNIQMDNKEIFEDRTYAGILQFKRLLDAQPAAKVEQRGNAPFWPGDARRTAQYPPSPSPMRQIHDPMVPVMEIFAGREGASGVFQPSQLIRNNITNRKTASAQPHFSSNASRKDDLNLRHSPYLGDSTKGQDPTLPDHLNCAVWVTDIHPQAGIADLLNAVRNCGRIFSTWINPSDPPKLPYSASKLVFTTRQGAERFINQAQSREGIIIFGCRISAIPNRIKYRDHHNLAQSRVLRISGPSRYVNYNTLKSYFRQLFFFHTVNIIETPRADGYRTIDWHFGSIVSQSAAAKKAIESEPMLKNVVTVSYLPDPCE